MRGCRDRLCGRHRKPGALLHRPHVGQWQIRIDLGHRRANGKPRLSAIESILGSVNAPVIPIHLDGVRGSIFSFERGRFSFRRPRRIPYPVTATVGAPRT